MLETFKAVKCAGLSGLPCMEVESRTKHCRVFNLPAWAWLHGGSLLKESDLGVIQKVSLHIKIHVQETFKKSYFIPLCLTMQYCAGKYSDDVGRLSKSFSTECSFEFAHLICQALLLFAYLLLSCTK